jgi:hypothetical protein
MSAAPDEAFDPDEDIVTSIGREDFPLVATTEEGGPFDTESFIAGSQFGPFDVLAALQVPVINGLIDERLVTQIDILSMAYGYLTHYDYATPIPGAVLATLYLAELDDTSGIPDSLPVD